MKNPLCQGSGGYTTTQIRAKAYPGIRELQVLQGLNDQAIVASICPANVTDPTRSDFGYRPAIAALIGRCATAPRPMLSKGAVCRSGTKQVSCTLIEVFNPPPGSSCDCDGDPGRSTATDDHLTAEMKALGSAAARCTS